MELLLDTHTFLWYVFGSSQLSTAATALLLDPANEKYLSIASPWEVGVKISTGKLTLSEPFEAYFDEQTKLNSIQMLPITLAHIARVSTLTLHHRDPFDRMLIAQSIIEGMPIISADIAFDAYGVARLW